MRRKAAFASRRVRAGREQFAAQMKAAEKVIRRYRNTLRELAR